MASDGVCELNSDWLTQACVRCQTRKVMSLTVIKPGFYEASNFELLGVVNEIMIMGQDSF